MVVATVTAVADIPTGAPQVGPMDGQAIEAASAAAPVVLEVRGAGIADAEATTGVVFVRE